MQIVCLQLMTWCGARRDEDPAEELDTRRQRLVPILEHTVGEAGSSPAEARIALHSPM